MMTPPPALVPLRKKKGSNGNGDENLKAELRGKGFDAFYDPE